jgi:rhodanese-related sulfurtransferase
MNSRKPEQIRPVRESGGHVVWQAVGILAAAMAIGMVYNQTSPLGVRKPTPPGEQPALPQIAAPTALSTGSAVAPTNLPGWNFLPPNSTAAATELRFPELKWPAVKTLLAANQIVLIDARLAETYALSRIPGAISLPAYSPVAELQAFAERFSRETRFVIYCNSESCDMSHELAAKLARQFGFTNLAIMPGGFAEYVIAESGAANPPSQ